MRYRQNNFILLRSRRRDTMRHPSHSISHYTSAFLLCLCSMADNIDQQLNALKTATEMGWMTKEDAKREFQRLYSLMGAGTGGGASPSASTGASPSSALQQAAASRQATTGSLKLQPAIVGSIIPSLPGREVPREILYYQARYMATSTYTST